MGMLGTPGTCLQEGRAEGAELLGGVLQEGEGRVGKRVLLCLQITSPLARNYYIMGIIAHRLYNERV